MVKVTCERCGRKGSAKVQWLPEGWEGTVNEPVCPGCQFAEWHPHCTSLTTWDGERVDLASMPREEWDLESLTRCEYMDLTVSWIEDADWPSEWTCPQCGGAEFEGVHRDYMPSGIQPGGADIRFEVQDD